MKKYYSVGRNNKWTNEPITIEEIKNIIYKLDPNAQVKISPARLHGDLTVWIDGYNMGSLFENQKDQMSFLRKKGLI